MAPTAFLLDGKAISEGVLAQVAEGARALAKRGVKPGLAVVLVGQDPASQAYVASKGRAALACGFHSAQHTLPADTREADLLVLIARLNADPAIHGVLIQLPLPGALSAARVIEAIAPQKDVDGLHPVQRRLAGDRRDRACDGALYARRRDGDDRQGLRSAGAGAGWAGGGGARPLEPGRQADRPAPAVAQLHGDDRPFAHPRDRRRGAAHGDVLIAAVGRAEMVRGDWIKPGAIVVDVGINRIPAPEKGAGKTRLVGDVAFAEAALRAGAITPVPGGVGKMTVAMLMANTLAAAQRAAG